MNLYKKTSPYTQLPDTQQRKFPRKLFRHQVSIGLPDGAIIQGYTIDVSAQGLSVLIPLKMNVGDVCAVRFGIMINGQIMRVAGAGRVANCSCAGEGFRIGMLFSAQDESVQQALADFVAS